ncbi:glycoside hydrolase family 3 N-terminal domain-containing protein [Acidipila sp. EB88]|uniref:glycoside hydrolase family 3 N-terminal domain-containing protein n=1 Tax=Acidipila sp. EB88 TaxID=2305226 RepID=UPI000F5F28F8|nr:glycoside hydrolase family 3 N-terminal domain-containing protein [Acidipila sp. EB88]RRA49439.1 glycoside hydrolase family 3 protein [Acidipila sp. EB88]
MSTPAQPRTRMPARNRLRHQVAQLFLVGLGGTTLDATERAWLRLLQPGGVILFRRNIENPAQTTALLREATEAAASAGEHIPSIRAVDLEGGLVDRLRDALAPMPSAALVAASGSLHDARRHGELIGRAVRLLGFNTCFAPVLDLALPESAPVMRTRVYGASAEKVVRYAEPFLQAMRGERVLASGKHFPGLGGGTLDSHHATPHIHRTWQQLWDEDMLPYRELLRLLPIIMVSHASYPRIVQAGDEPASVSHFWITETLRRRIGYEGLILSDDMEMGGLLTQMTIEEAALRAILAGSDLLEICRDPALVLRAYEAVLSEAERSTAFRAMVRRAWARVVAHKHRLLTPQLPRNSTEEQLTRMRSEILVFTAELEASERSRARQHDANAPVAAASGLTIAAPEGEAS